MLIAALVSSDAWQKIQADPWLALFDWLLLSDVTELTDCKSDLLVLEAGQIPSATPLGLPPQPCWCFDAGPHCWRLSSEVDVFDAPLDVEVLGMRLMAWMWLNNDLTPACFAGLSVSLTNGRLSFSTVEPTHYLMQMSVHPTAGVGGDVALYIESGARTLVVLADAIGHGDEAALDAAQFVLAVVRYIVPSRLNPQNIERLCRRLSRQIACGRFVAAAFIEFDRARREVRLLNAGMPDILSLRHGKLAQSYPSTQLPLGLSRCPNIDIHQQPLSACSQWVLYSDGVDSSALRQSLRLTLATLFTSSDCLETCSTAVALPLLKTREVNDDASQIIVGIPNF